MVFCKFSKKTAQGYSNLLHCFYDYYGNDSIHNIAHFELHDEGFYHTRTAIVALTIKLELKND